MTRRRVAALFSTVALLAGCGQTGQSAAEPKASPSPSRATETSQQHPAAPVRRKPLRDDERRVTVKLPQPYTPAAPNGVGTDDYRCFLLDPHVTRSSYITGFNVLPGNADVVHHVILFRVSKDRVAAAEQKDASSPGQGWTCFGDSGLEQGPQLDDAPWLGAWAPGGAEQVYPRGYGQRFDPGSRIVMQVHYNLLAGSAPDQSAAELRLAPARAKVKALRTQLMPAPVELPCRPGHRSNELCKRSAALADVKERFGGGPGATADLLHLLCGEVRPGPVQSCTRTVGKPETIRAVAGHMHLLGRSIRIETNPGTPRARTLLDIAVWDFDNQGSKPIKPVRLQPFDTIKVTCRHTQKLRDRLPAFEGQPDRYVLWGEGTTDEMCLGILLVTRP